MKLQINKIIVFILVFIFLCSFNITVNAQTWKDIDYTNLSGVDASEKLEYLQGANGNIENKDEAQLFIEKYNDLMENGKEYYNGLDATLRKDIDEAYKQANEILNGDNLDSNSEKIYYKNKWNNWWSIPTEEFNVQTYDDAHILYQFLTNSSITKENMSKDFLDKYIQAIETLKKSPGFIIYDTQGQGNPSKKLDSIYRDVYADKDLMDKIKGTEAEEILDNSPVVDFDAGGNYNSPIYYAPDKIGSVDTSAGNLDDVINDADDFINSGGTTGIGTVNQSELQKFSGTLYNILLSIGVAVSVIVGAILGIKLMISGVEEKAEVKKLILPYVIGCIVVFGGFTIWKVVVEIVSGV